MHYYCDVSALYSTIRCQLLILVIDRTTPEFALTIAAIPIVLILLITCGLAVKREIKWYVATSYESLGLADAMSRRLMTVSLILMAAALTYL